MALLTKDGLDRVIQLLISEGLVDQAAVQAVQEEVERTHKPLLETLTTKKIVTNEMIQHATAVIMGVPYVDLKNVEMEQEVLELLKQKPVRLPAWDPMFQNEL